MRSFIANWGAETVFQRAEIVTAVGYPNTRRKFPPAMAAMDASS